MGRPWSFLLLASGCAAASLGGQTPIYRWFGQQDGEQMGRSIALAGDADGDGRADVVAGLPLRSASAVWAGGARALSGRSGAVLWSVEGSAPGDRLGWSVAGIGDVNADGRADLALGAPYDDVAGTDAGAVLVCSGRDGSVLFALRGQTAGDGFGWTLAALGDVDGDATPDFAAGAPFTDHVGLESGSVYVVSGKGAVLRRHDGARGYDLFGWSVAGGGDVDRDGRPDLAASAVGLLASGAVHVLSGRTGASLRVHSAAGQSEFGQGLALLPDADGDGAADVALSAAGFSASLQNHGEVHVFSGATGSRLWSAAGEAPWTFFGHALAAAGDVDGDGRSDVVSGSRSGYVRVLSGRDAGLLARVAGSSGDEMGTAVAGGADVDGDGKPDLVAGAWRAEAARGSVAVHATRLMPLATDRHALSLAKGGTQAFALQAGAAQAGQLYLVMGSASGTTPGFSAGSVRVPLNPDAYLAFTLGNPNRPPLTATFGALDAQGSGSAAFVLPTGLSASLAGLVLDHAFLVLDARVTTPRAASNAVPLLLQP